MVLFTSLFLTCASVLANAAELLPSRTLLPDSDPNGAACLDGSPPGPSFLVPA